MNMRSIRRRHRRNIASRSAAALAATTAITVGLAPSASAANGPTICRFTENTIYYSDISSHPSQINAAASNWNTRVGTARLYTAGVGMAFQMSVSDSNFGDIGWAGAVGTQTAHLQWPWCVNGRWAQQPYLRMNTYPGIWNLSTVAGLNKYTKIATHEFGHALGLMHWNGTPAAPYCSITSIMAETIYFDPPCVSVPSTEDVGTINALYPAPAK